MQRNTSQRKLVLDALASLEGEHPGAEQVYERVHADHPTVSKATVYRILKDEAASGRVLGVDLPRDIGRFDSRTDGHYHIRCRICGKVADIERGCCGTDGLFVNNSGYEIEDITIAFSGVCAECAAAERGRTGA